MDCSKSEVPEKDSTKGEDEIISPKKTSEACEDGNTKNSRFLYNIVLQHQSQPSTSKDERYFTMIDLDDNSSAPPSIYTKDTGPHFYQVKGEVVTDPIIPKNLPGSFGALPIGQCPPDISLEEFQQRKIREFVGGDINDEEFQQLAQYCSPDNLKTGKELCMTYKSLNRPTDVPSFVNKLHTGMELNANNDCNDLCTIRKSKQNKDADTYSYYQKRMKYRGVKLLPAPTSEEVDPDTPDQTLQVGKDLIFRVRFYRQFHYNYKERIRGRHSLLSHEVVLSGRCTVRALRERLACANDADMRLNVANNLTVEDDVEAAPSACAKELFPSGFLFINNVFYTSAGERDLSAGIRSWAARRRIGVFPVRSADDTRIEDLVIRLGHPEVYIHQGNCEHLFSFSEIRLLKATDPLRLSLYPYHAAVAQNQTVYCTTCAEFSAKWIVTDCPRVPFDPAFFCDTCFRHYLYKDDKPIGHFKAYSFKMNEINVFKPQ